MDTTIADIDTQDESYSMLIGDRAHRVIGTILTEGVADTRALRTSQTLTTTAQVLRDRPMQHSRARAASMEIATAAACYIHRFLLDSQWEFQGAEQPLGGGRADLLFRHAPSGEWLVDEVKTSRGRTDETKLRPQIDRYLTGGQQRWGGLFVGVRLCALAAPRTSRLYTPTSKRSVPLAGTSLVGGVA